MTQTWIDINLNAIINNYQEVKKHLNPSSRVLAVIKADAYGMGAAEVAYTLSKEGCDAFAVTTVEEALILREHGIEAMILVLGPVSNDQLEMAIAENLQITLSDVKMIEPIEKIASRLGQEIQVHIKLETGMGRTGIFLDDLNSLAGRLKSSPHIKPVAVYTHLARAAQRDSEYTKKQFERFMKGITSLEELGITGLKRHICNSAAFLDYPEWHFDFVRIGTLLIGHFPSRSFSGKLHLQDPWMAKTRIVQVRKVPKGTFVGYQSIYKTKEEKQLAVVPIGYADGFGVVPHFIPQGFIDFIKIIIKNFLALVGVYVGQETVTYKGKKVRIAGKIGMQLTVIDIGNEDCQVGDEVIFPLRRAQANPRLLRQYWKDQRLVSKRTIKEGIQEVRQEFNN